MNRTRLSLFALLLFATPLFAANNRLDGKWASNIDLNGQRCTLNLEMASGNLYTEVLQCGSLATAQSGTYVFYPNGLLERTVCDWSPKKRFVLDNGYRGHYEWNAKPPGGKYQVTFTSANTMSWRDVNFGGTLTLHRL